MARPLHTLDTMPAPSLFPAVLFSRSSDEWATPDRLVAELEQEFGAFTLDPCARAHSAKAPRYFTIEDDGLSHPWAPERVFLNPPYSRVGEWMAKAVAESRRGALVVCLVPSRTDTAWWHETAERGEVRFVRGRLRFNGAKKDAPFPSAIVVFRPPSASTR